MDISGFDQRGLGIRFGSSWPARRGLCLAAALGIHLAMLALAFTSAPAPPPSQSSAPPLIVDLAALSPAASADGPEQTQAPAPAPTAASEPEPAPEPPRASDTTAPSPSVPLSRPPHSARAKTPNSERRAAEPTAATRSRAAEPAQRDSIPTTDAPASAPPEAAAAPADRAADAGALKAWQTDLLNRLQVAKRYPASAREDDEQGVATVAFVLDRAGHVLSVHLVQSAGSDALDAEAVALVRRAQPLTPLPPEIGGETIKLTVPIAFSLR